MGLDLYLLEPVGRDDGGHVSWPYSGFNRFRERLCADAGMGDLGDYEGFGGAKPWPLDRPLVRLLHHSDCDGELDSWECEGLGDAIRAVIRLWPDDDHDRVRGERLAAMIDRAADNWGVVSFR